MIEKNFGILNVKDFGALGDGMKDDTVALQAAINYAHENGSNSIFLPTGLYKTTASLILPEPVRPSTNAVPGSGFRILGNGMYDSGIIYNGTEYAIFSDKVFAESICFEDFYINHMHGGGIRLPQGAHQMFERFFSSACAEGKYGVIIEGNRSANDVEGGYGAYMTSFRNCRFWSEQGYNGTGLRLENIPLNITIDNCFFSRSVTNAPHLELFRCYGVHITACSFERSELQSFEANKSITSPLIKIDQCSSVSILESHAEATYPAFVGIFNHSSNILIDGCDFDHFAIADFNPQKGYIVDVDAGSVYSRDIIIGKRNNHIQANNTNTTHGLIINDPVHCVKVEGFVDSTPFSDASYTTERRFVSRIGESASNILINPALYADGNESIPLGVEAISGSYSFSQLSPSGCKVIQKETTPDIPYRLRFKTSETVNKYDIYTCFVVGRNYSGKSVTLWIDLGGDTNNSPLYLPAADTMFTMPFTLMKQSTDIIDLVAYGAYELDILSMYLVPNLTYEAPYGSELLSASKLFLGGAEIKQGRQIPSSGGRPGDIIFNSSPALNNAIGWVCVTANKWVPFGQITPQLTINNLNTLPLADETQRGRIVLLETSNNVGDSIYMCKKLKDGKYDWVEIG